jgi:predicted transcriptional regulator
MIIGSKNMKRRSRLEIYFDILDVVTRGIDKPTQIMYKTNLSWATLQGIFDMLIQGGFIKEEIQKNAKRYQVTDKGRNALAYYRKSLDGLVNVNTVFSK